jgi:N-acetylmuramoyl-L-alanine amidase
MVVVGMRFFAGLVACALALSAGTALASDITNVRFGAYETHTRIVIESETPLDSRAFTLAEPVSRLVVSFDQAGWSVPGLPNRQGQGEGLVGRFQFDGQAGAPRLVFALNSPSTVDHHFSLAPDGGGYRTVVDLAPVGAAAFQQTSGFPSESTNMAQFLVENAVVSAAPPACEAVRVVIDPGHGGRDPGALARFGGGDEADVNLAAGLVLRDILNATGRYEVIMTRDRDVYVDLYDRVEIARQAEADLFISLHADSAGNSTGPEGATVYSMNHRAVDRARSRAISQGDWVDPNRPEEVSRILVEMSLTNKESQSERFADALRTEVGRVQPLFRETAMRANFAVLIDAEVPAVLFEMGFLTNRNDARRLNSATDRRRLMQSAASAIDEHFSHCQGGGPDHYIAQNAVSASSTR